MSNLGKDFDRAARHYENQEPPEPTPKIECDKCDGYGVLPISDCCEAEIMEGFCSECLERCSRVQCDKCKGEGEVCPPEPDADMGRIEHDDCGDN